MTQITAVCTVSKYGLCTDKVFLKTKFKTKLLQFLPVPEKDHLHKPDMHPGRQLSTVLGHKASSQNEAHARICLLSNDEIPVDQSKTSSR